LQREAATPELPEDGRSAAAAVGGRRNGLVVDVPEKPVEHALANVSRPARVYPPSVAIEVVRAEAKHAREQCAAILGVDNIAVHQARLVLAEREEVPLPPDVVALLPDRHLADVKDAVLLRHVYRGEGLVVRQRC
jgi:hypothetical protein